MTNVSEAPAISSGATASFAENGTGTAYTVTGTDADAGTTLSYALGGTDAAKFVINASSGAVTFVTVPNFGAPTDAGGNNVYDITVTANDGVNTSAARAVAITVTDVVESLAGQSVIDLGSYGKLIAPVQIEGAWYYYWDRSGDGSFNGGTDYTTHDVLDGIFNQDIAGATGGGGNTTDAYRYATLSGVHLALPTANGGGAYPQGINSYQNGTTYTDAGATTNSTASSFNELLAIWDAYNGTGTGRNISNDQQNGVPSGVPSGTPTGWEPAGYWSATPSASGHANVNLVYGIVNDGNDSGVNYVVLQVLPA